VGAIVGYSRAVRVGSTVHVRARPRSGPTARSSGSGTRTCRRCRHSRTSSGAGPGRRIAPRRGADPHVRDHIADWERVGRAHGEVFGDIRPASTLVAVSSLVRPSCWWKSRRKRSCRATTRFPDGGEPCRSQRSVNERRSPARSAARRTGWISPASRTVRNAAAAAARSCSIAHRGHGRDPRRVLKGTRYRSCSTVTPTGAVRAR